MDIEKKIAALVKQAIKKNFRLAADPVAVNLTYPKRKEFGDFSTNVALELARKLSQPPLEIARQLAETLQQGLSQADLADQVEKIEVKGTGFINFFLSKSCLYEILPRVRKQAGRFGRLKLGQKKRVHLEFVSANPTGPLNVAHARQAAFGDSLANILEFCGYRVFREYYLNDEGVQIGILGESVRAKYLERLGRPYEFPVSGYRGKYIDDLAAQLVRRYGRRLAKNSPNSIAFFSRFAYSLILREIKADLLVFGVKYNRWFSQQALSRSGRIKRVLAELNKRGFIYQQDGAWWLATTKFGDDKDRVVVKSDHNLTYIAPDIAYHQTKFQRRFDQMVNIWGPDHHGYIPRLRAAVSALGYDAECLSFLIVQLVSLSSADQIIPMSTRLGQYISLADIIRAVGKDAARFFFLMRKRDAHLNFDLSLAKKQSLENPVYYIQYAHARCLNILRFAKGNQGRRINLDKNIDLSLLDKPEETGLIQRLRMFPSAVEHCALNLEPHRMTIYLQDLAKDLHHYYERQRVVTEDLETTAARLVLVDATRVVLGNGLRLLAIAAPEKM